MKKIKIIDLLNMICKGEEVPKKIKWEKIIYAYSEYDKDYLEYPFSDEEYEGLFNMKDSILTQFLNDEVEIIEEKKLPEKLPKWATTREDKEYTNVEYHVLEVAKKVDEIINYLESKEKGE